MSATRLDTLAGKRHPARNRPPGFTRFAGNPAARHSDGRSCGGQNSPLDLQRTLAANEQAHAKTSRPLIALRGSLTPSIKLHADGGPLINVDPTRRIVSQSNMTQPIFRWIRTTTIPKPF